MNPLHTECARLYYAEPQHALLHDASRSPLVGADGQVRCAVLELAGSADWNALAAVWRGVQQDLELPAPAIAINGWDGYQLWFAWQQAISAARAHGFLQNLIGRYLHGVSPTRLRCWPDARSEDDGFPARIATQHPRSGQWSAFIAPDLASVFAEEPWLDREPGHEAQAQLLARLQGMDAAAFANALQTLQPVPTAQQPPVGHAPDVPEKAHARSTYPTHTPDAFLQAVMQDPQAPLPLRIQAATSLLTRG